jgi:hypothetical protein
MERGNGSQYTPQKGDTIVHAHCKDHYKKVEGQKEARVLNGKGTMYVTVLLQL